MRVILARLLAVSVSLPCLGHSKTREGINRKQRSNESDIVVMIKKSRGDSHLARDGEKMDLLSSRVDAHSHLASHTNHSLSFFWTIITTNNDNDSHGWIIKLHEY